MQALPHMKSPCANCPFRKDVQPGWLGKERMREILAAPSFVCHKTTKGKVEDRKQCAGHMLIRRENNYFFLLAWLKGIELNLKGEHLVFENEADCIIHHDQEK